MSCSAQKLGTHLLLDGWGAPPAVLDDPKRIRSALEDTVKVARLTLLRLQIRRFAPQGITAVGILAESHLAIHTWPEHGAFAADLFHCGELTIEEVPRLVRHLAVRLEASHWSHHVVERVAFGVLEKTVRR